MSANIGGDRPVNFCPLCKQVDDHPRHRVWGRDANLDPHKDCCALAGCPDGTCDVVLTNHKGETGADMLAYLQKQHEKRDIAAEHEAHLEENPEKRNADYGVKIATALEATP